MPTGTQLFDWTVPREWTVRGAYIATLDGRRVVDFAASNLHLVQYSVPVDRIVERGELLRHLHTLPETPDWIPYRTSYYSENWGFCLSRRQAERLTEERYRVVIDTTLAPGHLTYGELLLPGAQPEEVLLSCHSCHPSLANDNLSGIAVAVMLARRLMARQQRRLTYRFLFIPGTIGSLAWLAANEARVPLVTHGLVLSCLGDGAPFTYKQSRRGDAAIDRIAAHVLQASGEPYRVQPFSPYGYDERQYCSPGFDMPVGCLMRSPNGTFPEYHTSADNLGFIRPAALAGAHRDADAHCRRHRGRRDLPQPQPEGRAAARQARALPADRRAERGRRLRSDGAALGAEPRRWQAFAARHRRARGNAVRGDPRRSGCAAQGGAAGAGRSGRCGRILINEPECLLFRRGEAAAPAGAVERKVSGLAAG